MKTHAQVPTVYIVNEKVWRIYFSSRDPAGKSRIGFIDVESHNPSHILYKHPEPILDLGPLGSFDEAGVMPSWVLQNKNRVYLYYIGWFQGKNIPYHNSIGLAISTDNGQSFKKYAEGPVFGRTLTEPYFTGTSCILIDKGIWKNWYMSCVGWTMVGGKPEPRYHIKYAESLDGICWKRDALVAIDFKSPDEAGIVKASVLKVDDVYLMWYAYRQKRGYRTNPKYSYRIGYAESLDGVVWERKDTEAGIQLSQSGWDSQMIAYPHVFEMDNKRYLFYNGNGFGQSGLGYALWEES